MIVGDVPYFVKKILPDRSFSTSLFDLKSIRWKVNGVLDPKTMIILFLIIIYSILCNVLQKVWHLALENISLVNLMFVQKKCMTFTWTIKLFKLVFFLLKCSTQTLHTNVFSLSPEKKFCYTFIREIFKSWDFERLTKWYFYIVYDCT